MMDEKHSKKETLSPDEELLALLGEHAEASQMVKVFEDVQNVGPIGSGSLDLNEAIREKERRMNEIAIKISSSPLLTEAFTRYINPGVKK